MLGWIPIIGPIIDGIVSIFAKWQDTNLEKYKVEGTVSIEAMKTSAQIIADTKDDIGIRLSRDLLIFPVCVWTAIISWDTIMVHRHPELVFIVEKYPDSVSYLPYAVMMFLLGNVAMLKWWRK